MISGDTLRNICNECSYEKKGPVAPHKLSASCNSCLPFSKASYATSKRSLFAGSMPAASFVVTEKNGASKEPMSSSRKKPDLDVI